MGDDEEEEGRLHPKGSPPGVYEAYQTAEAEVERLQKAYDDAKKQGNAWKDERDRLQALQEQILHEATIHSMPWFREQDERELLQRAEAALAAKGCRT